MKKKRIKKKRTHKIKKINKKKLQQFLKKKFKYYNLLKVQENTDLIAKKNILTKYNYFRKSNFLFTLPKPKILKKKNFLKEIAEILQINEGTVKSRLFYATKFLANQLSVYQLNE
jgi:hypothetical protein